MWEAIVGKGRIIQWLVVGGGVALMLVGGTQGWLDEDKIMQVFLAMIAAAFGLEQMKKE